MRIRLIVSKEIELTSSRRMNVICVGGYGQPFVSLLLAKSYGNRTTAHQLGTLLWHYSTVRYVPFDVIVPIPLHWTRFSWRGYNQVDEIARVIARQAQKPVVNLLTRHRRTPYQSYFKGKGRQRNVEQAFRLNENASQYRGKHLLLVDDVMTSGSTLKEAAKIMYTIQPASVTAVVVARI